MSFFSILVIALGLAMDAAAVSVTRGAGLREIRARHCILVALYFGGSQAAMPLVGWVLGAKVGPFVESWAHWIAFVLLFAIGAKMLHEARAHAASPESPAPSSDPFEVKVMLLLALATSIDALAVGITLPMLNAPLVISLLTIGGTTALLSIVGLVVGRRFGTALGRRFDAFGGVVLILIGLKILIDGLRGR